MKSITAIITLAMTLISYAAVTHAGVYVETVSRNKATGKEAAAYSMQVQDGKARMAGGTRGSVSIFKEDTLYVLDAQRKTYMAMDRAMLEQTANTMNDAMAKMREQMAKLPPEQRAMMENMMKQRGVPGAPSSNGSTTAISSDATPTGATEKIDGRSCKVWNITRDGKLTSQVCVVAFSGLPGKDEFQALAKKMSALFEKLPEAIRNQSSGNPFQQDAGIGAKMNGMPFITRSYRDGALDPEETVVKSWKEQSIPATQFDIPADYVKQELPMGRPRK